MIMMVMIKHIFVPPTRDTSGDVVRILKVVKTCINWLGKLPCPPHSLFLTVKIPQDNQALFGPYSRLTVLFTCSPSEPSDEPIRSYLPTTTLIKWSGTWLICLTVLNLPPNVATCHSGCSSKSRGPNLLPKAQSMLQLCIYQTHHSVVIG